MTKLIGTVLLCSIFTTSVYCAIQYSGSTTAPVTLAGAIISAKHSEVDKKYKRSECPVCKGKGWYISGDDIAKVDCGYCEPDKTQNSSSEIIIKKR